MLTNILKEKLKDTYYGKIEDDFSADEILELKNMLIILVADELDEDPQDIDEDMDFEDLGLDSVSYLEIFDEVKKTLNISIPTGKLMSFARTNEVRTINGLATFVIDFLKIPN